MRITTHAFPHITAQRTSNASSPTVGLASRSGAIRLDVATPIPLHGAPPPPVTVGAIDAGDLHDLLMRWELEAVSLLERTSNAETQVRLHTSVRLTRELLGFLETPSGLPGRTLRAASCNGTVQCVAVLAAAHHALYAEYLLSAPWNLLMREAHEDARTVRGACSAIIVDAVGLSAADGFQGRLALEADNPHCQEVYTHMGFRPMTLVDGPQALVPDTTTAPLLTSILERHTLGHCMLLDPATSLTWRRREQQGRALRPV